MGDILLLVQISLGINVGMIVCDVSRTTLQMLTNMALGLNDYEEFVRFR